MNPYEIPLPPLDEAENIERSSPTISERSNNKGIELNANNTDMRNKNTIKSRTISSSSTVSEKSVYNPPKKKEQLNVQTDDNNLSETNVILTVALPNSIEDITNNEKPLLSQQTMHANDISKRKLHQLYANTNIESAIRSCDGITSM